MKKRILALGIVLLFLTSAVNAEVASAHSFCGFAKSNNLCQSSFISDKAFICPGVPDHRTIRLSEHANSFISYHRRTSSIRYIPDGSIDLNRYTTPEDNRITNEIADFPGHEHHPGEEIIRYIHDQDGEKENPTFL